MVEYELEEYKKQQQQHQQQQQQQQDHPHTLYLSSLYYDGMVIGSESVESSAFESRH